MDMIFVRGGRRNMVSVGWEDYVLQVEFKDGKRYQYGGVPLEVKEKLLRVPYPDNLFRQIVVGKYVSKRVDEMPRAQPPVINMDELPF